MDIKDYIRTVPDFPTKGVMFRDITTVLQDARGFKLAIDEMQKKLADIDFDIIAGIESRGFIFGSAIAYNMGKAFVPVRKAGKLPFETVSQEYSLEYGTAVIEMHKDSVKPGQRVVLVDDLIATGGTVKAAAQLVEKLGGSVACMLFLIELPALGGRDVLKDYDVRCITAFDGD